MEWGKVGAPIISPKTIHPTATDHARAADSRSARLEWVDTLRGWGMIMVVLGHSILGLISAHITDAHGWARIAVLGMYETHIQIIFFVAGLVSRDHKKPFSSLFQNQMLFVLYPYVLWSIVLVISQNLSPGHVNQRIGYEALLDIWWEPISIYWFLYAFFIVKMIDFATARLLGAGAPLLLVLLGAGVFAAGSVYGVPQPRSPLYLVHYGAGCLFFYGLARQLGDRRAWLDTAMVWLDGHVARRVAVVVIAAGVIGGFLRYYAALPDAEAWPLAGPQNGFLITGMAGVAGFVVLARLFSGGILGQASRQIGVCTMSIYLMHTIFGAAARSVLVKLHLGTGGVLAGVMLMGIILPMGVQWVGDTTGLGWLIGLRPVQLWKKGP